VSPLPTPKGRQSEVVHLSADRHHVVLGTAGTGKSTMAMLRARHLARASTENNGPVLIVTYNNTLVTYLKYLGPEVAGQITIETYGKFARGYLASLGLMHWGAIATPSRVRALVTTAVREVIASGVKHPVLSRDVDWIVDEIHWVSGMGLRSEAEYQTATRVGRMTPLAAGEARAAVWAVRERYAVLRANAGLLYDWYDIAGAVSDALAADERPRKYRHIIIDEGQDLSPQAIRSLTEAVQPGGSLTFFGDYHQAIYGQGMSWRASGIRLGNRRVEKFVDNYRNTTQVANLALAMAKSKYMTSADEDLVIPQAPVAAGPLPTLVEASDLASEILYIRELIKEASKDQSVAVLGRTWADVQRVVSGLPCTKLNPEMPVWTGTPGIYAGTYHSAKGLEFEAVVMPFLDEGTVPLPDVLATFAEDEACSREARLLYVALTRAKSTLVMSHHGTLTRLLPPNKGEGGDALWNVEKP